MERMTVDLSTHPDLVVIYLGMRVRSLRGMRTLRAIRDPIRQSAAARPDGLLRHEPLIYSLRPLHLGMRQYWRDFDTLQNWSRSLPHKRWWDTFIRDTGGTGFWHEAYFMRGGMEAVYVEMPEPLGLGTFAPELPATGALLTARRRRERLLV